MYKTELDKMVMITKDLLIYLIAHNEPNVKNVDTRGSNKKNNLILPLIIEL